jgi:hypothetical protein
LPVQSSSGELHGYWSVAGTVYVVMDYDLPRFGLIRLDYADEALEATLKGMQ